MSTIDPLSAQLPPFRNLPAADVKITLRDNTTGVKELTYGNRLPSARGYQREHDHGQWGGLHVGQPLERYAFGPYLRVRGDLDPGIALCPPRPIAAISFSTGKAKLVAALPARIIGGVTGVHLDMLVLPELGGASPQALTLGCVLRPGGLSNFNNFLGNVTEAAMVFGHMKRMIASLSGSAPVKQRVTFSDLTRLGSPAQHRFAELCFFLCSDIGASNLIHLLSASLLVATVSTDVRSPATGYPPDQEVPLSQILAGQTLTAGLGSQARSRGNALSLSILGGQPGMVAGQLNPARAMVQELDGAHQHQGVEILQSDGTVESDGALWPYTVGSQGYQILDEVGSDEFPTSDPCKGLKVSPTGVITAATTFFQEIPLAAGAKAVRFRFALRPEVTAPKTRLAVVAHLCRSNVTPSATNNVIGQVNGSTTIDASGYVVGTVEPEQTPGYQANEPRTQQGLGNWTRDAEEDAAFLTPGVRQENSWRISQEVELKLISGVRITEPYTLRYRFWLYSDQTETAVDTAAGLIWAHAYASE